MSHRPHILLLADQPGWAYDRAAQGIARALESHFEFTIRYVADRPDLAAVDYDLLHVFYWGETWHRDQLTDPHRIVKEISSHRFQSPSHGAQTPPEMAVEALQDAAVWGCTSKRLLGMFSELGEAHWIPNGFDPRIFHAHGREDSGRIRIGWAGNAKDSCKGLEKIIVPAAGSDFTIQIADGSLTPDAMGEFYRGIDVLCVASTAEGEPLTLIEALACGCTALAVDVGIVPELIEPGETGWILERDPASFRAAFQWTEQNPQIVRSMGVAQANRMAHTRTWDHVAPHWHRLWAAALARQQGQPRFQRSAPTHQLENHERNLGEDLGSWPARAQVASQMLRELPLPRGASILDLGCGTQPLRESLRKDLVYFPVDRLPRSADTLILDLDKEFPAGSYECALVLGVLEYLEDPGAFLTHLAASQRFVLLSCNDGSDADKRERQHWNLKWSFLQLEQELLRRGFVIRACQDLGLNERVYSLSVPDSSATEIPRVAVSCTVSDRGESSGPIKKLALFSAAVHGDNSGDALIEDAIRRLLPGYETERFPLHYAPSEEEVERANTCDLGILCGTNLYQHSFASGLSDRVLDRLDLPLLPLGVGGSAPLGQPIHMQKQDTRRVLRIHERTTAASTRDPVSLQFLHSLGITNVSLTGCPVLFHALGEPQFESVPTGSLVVSVRARLLHIDEIYGEKQISTICRLAEQYKPHLVLQSPYDFALAHTLARHFDLELRFDPEFQVGPLVDVAKKSGATLGFRLHYGMLSLAYGKPARFLGTDTRTESFCQMMGLPHEDLRSYDEDRIVHTAMRPLEDPSGFLSRWRNLANGLIDVLETNGLQTSLKRPSPDTALRNHVEGVMA